jgi:mRNA interferase YafQ
MREIIRGKKFKRDYAKIAASGRYSLDDFLEVIQLLMHDKPLPERYQDHALKGEWIGYRECHIKPDWLLIYEKSNSPKKLILARTGSHSELFS